MTLPASIAPADVRKMNGTAWTALALWCAGYAFQGTWQRPEEIEPASPEDRAKAAALIEQALDGMLAEMNDDIRAAMPTREAQRLISVAAARQTAEEMVEFARFMLSNRGRADAAMLEGQAVLDSLDADDPRKQLLGDALAAAGRFQAETAEAQREGEEAMRCVIFAWDVLKEYRADPSRVLGMEELTRLKQEGCG